MYEHDQCQDVRHRWLVLNEVLVVPDLAWIPTWNGDDEEKARYLQMKEVDHHRYCPCGVVRWQQSQLHSFVGHFVDRRAGCQYCEQKADTGYQQFSRGWRIREHARRGSCSTCKQTNCILSRSKLYQTPFKCIGPILTTCLVFSDLRIPSRRPRVMPATFRSFVPLIK